MSRDFREAEAEAASPVNEMDDLQGSLVIVTIPVQMSFRAWQQTSRLVEPNA